MRVPENKPVLEINKNLFMLLFTLLMLRKKPTADIYLFKFNNRNTRKRWKICLVKTFFTPFSSVSNVNLEQENVDREVCFMLV